MYTLLVPVLVNGIIMENTLRAIFCFTSVFCYHALNNIGDNLEDPYLPYDPNELPLPELQHSVNMRLFAMGVVPEPEASHEEIELDMDSGDLKTKLNSH